MAKKDSPAESSDGIKLVMHRDRRVFLTSELPDHLLEVVRKAKVPDEYAYLDDELKDWNP
jgi:hypothetical protein